MSRALGGIAAALLMPSVTAYVADLTTLGERAKAMGKVSAAISGGFIIGPGVGGFLATFGIRVPFCGCTISFHRIYFEYDCVKRARKTMDINPDTPKASFLDILKNPMFTSLLSLF